MANTYTWSVDSLDCIPSFDDKTNVVSVVHWRVTATDNAIPTPCVAFAYSTQVLTYTEKSLFTAYDNLTKDAVVGWVQEAMGIDAVTKLQEALDKQIEILTNPPVVTPPLPWGSQ